MVGYEQGLRAFLEQSSLLRSGLRVLDAGCLIDGMSAWFYPGHSKDEVCACYGVDPLASGTNH